MRTRRSKQHAETGREPLWAWAAASGTLALVAAVLTARIQPAPESFLGRLWPSDASAAASLLQSVMTASVTMTTLTFTLTVVSLQLASQQFSPRLLREFTTDRVTKLVLAAFVAAFVFSLVSLRTVNAAGPVPVVNVLLAALLGITALTALISFITHLVKVLRVDTMMVRVHDEADRALHMFYPEKGDERPRSPDEVDLPSTRGRYIHARGSGFVQSVDVEKLVEGARRAGAVVRLEVRPGDHVVLGSPMATVWERDTSRPVGREASKETAEAVADVVDESVKVGYERTIEQDAAFGFRQLEDIAVKAVSPGINDPVTAVHAVGHMADLLVKLAGRRLGATLHLDEEGVGRAVVPDRDLAYYLEVACGQLRRYAGNEPSVLNALLAMLRDLANAVEDPDQAGAVRAAAESVVGELDGDLSETDQESVKDMHRRVLAALEKDERTAYADRAGETRST